MSDYILMCESTSDLSPELVKMTGAYVMPTPFIIDGTEYLDDPDNSQMEPVEFFNQVRGGAMPSTAQVSGELYKDVARVYLQKGVDILYISFSSALSGGYNAIRIASEELSEEFPDRKVIAIDSKCASMGLALLVYHASLCQKAGNDIDTVAKFVEDTKLCVSHWFTVDDLNHLHRGGRLSKAAAVVGTMMGIKPILNVNDEGQLKSVGKARGRKNSLDALVEKVGAHGTDFEAQTIMISHGDCAEDCNYVAEQIKAKYGVKEVFTNFIGPSIGTHSGPGTVALFFMSKNR